MATSTSPPAVGPRAAASDPEISGARAIPAVRAVDASLTVVE